MSDGRETWTVESQSYSNQTEWMLPKPYEQMMLEFNVGDRVRNKSIKSRFRGKIGVIVKKDFSLHVKYPDEPVIGRHPPNILEKINKHFDEELFEL